MSGGTSTLWRASLCSVVMAFAVFGTGCAIENGDAADSDEDLVESQAELTVSIPKPTSGLQAPKKPVGGIEIPKLGGQIQSPTGKHDQIVEPEPEPWHPDGRGGSGDPDDLTTSTASDRTDDHK